MTLSLPQQHPDALPSAAGSARPAKDASEKYVTGGPWGARRGSSATHFACGHGKTPENTYGDVARQRCRQCCLSKARQWRIDNQERRKKTAKKYLPRKLKVDRRYRRQHQLAFQLYFHLRRLMMRDGCWPGRGEKAERSAA